MVALTRDEAVAIVEQWTLRQREGKKTPPGGRLEAAADYLGRLRPEFDSFEAWFGRITPLPGRYVARALAAAWTALAPDERVAATERVKKEAAGNRPQAAIWLAGLLAAVDSTAADNFVSIAAAVLRDRPGQDVVKAMCDALIGSVAPSPLEQLAARPSSAVLRVWRAIVMHGRIEHIPPSAQVGVLAAGVRLACQAAGPTDRSRMLAVIVDSGRHLAPPDWERVVAAADEFPEAAGVLDQSRSGLDQTRGTGGPALGSTPTRKPAGAASETPAGRIAIQPRVTPSGAVDEALDAPRAGSSAIEPGTFTRVPTAAAADRGAVKHDGGGTPWTRPADVEGELAVQDAIGALAKFVEAFRTLRRRAEAIDARFRGSEEHVREAEQAAAAAHEHSIVLERRLAEASQENHVLESRVSELQSQVESLQGFGERRFQAGRDQLAAKLARDLSLHLEHVRRFAEAGTRTDGEQHLLRVIDGMVRELAGHGVVVPWQ